jgi:predicted CoA-binding protein
LWDCLRKQYRRPDGRSINPPEAIEGRQPGDAKERIKNMKLGKNNFVVTFKTEDEVVEYMNRHIPEERRLLWLGFFIANNYIAQRLEDEGVDLTPKDKK